MMWGRGGWITALAFPWCREGKEEGRQQLPCGTEEANGVIHVECQESFCRPWIGFLKNVNHTLGALGLLVIINNRSQEKGATINCCSGVCHRTSPSSHLKQLFLTRSTNSLEGLVPELHVQIHFTSAPLSIQNRCQHGFPSPLFFLCVQNIWFELGILKKFTSFWVLF